VSSNPFKYCVCDITYPFLCPYCKKEEVLSRKTVEVKPITKKTMKIIYIAGAYRDKRGEWFVTQNIRKAEAEALYVWQLGAVALCPHKNTALFGGSCDDSIWLGDLELLRRSDAIYLIDGWQNSEGTLEEARFAGTHNIPKLFSRWEVKQFIFADKLPSRQP
jgi:hypothetical protein